MPPLNVACDTSLWDPAPNNFDITILVRVDNVTYAVLGYESESVRYVLINNMTLSPTQTKVTIEAGPMQINLTFLNPIEPNDWVKQSIPFSYVSLTARSLDGAAHSVQVYTELVVEWPSAEAWGGRSSNTSDVLYYQLDFMGLSNGTPGVLYQATKNDDSITYQWYTLANASILSFQDTGRLENKDSNIVPPGLSDIDTFAISHNLGTIQATQEPIVWVVGFITQSVLDFADLSGAPAQERSLYYTTQYSEGEDEGEAMILDFLNDFSNASSRAQQLDTKILQDATPISGMLRDLVSFATPQIYGSIQLTIPFGTKGYSSKSDAMAFMKNAGWTHENHGPNQVNAVTTLYMAFPAFMYLDPGLGGLFLEPLLWSQASPNYTNPYAAPDLGTAYPNVTISNSANSQGIEDSGNMLIMTYAQARASGDDGLIIKYYSLLTSWADYLSDATLLIHNQSSADGLMSSNQTNLAIKGIIAIKAMSKMSSIVEQAPDVNKYSNIAANLYAQWKSLALTSGQHLLAVYGHEESWTLGYNIFADVWLGTNVVESSVYDGQSSFLDNLWTSNFINTVLPIDSLSTATSEDPDPDQPDDLSGWNMWVAAMTTDQDLRTKLISGIYNQSQFSGASAEVFFGGSPGPAPGAMYAPLALLAPVRLVVNSTQAETPHTGTPTKSHTGVVTKAVVGGVVALLAVGTIGLVAWHRRRRSHGHGRTSVWPTFLGESTNQGTQVTVTPFNPTMLTPTEVAPLAAETQMDFPQRLFSRTFSPGGLPLPLRRMMSVPIGLSGKELAQLRSNRLRSQSMVGQSSHPPLTITIGRDALEGAEASPTSSSEIRRPRSENNFSRYETHEIQQLLGERSESPPPSYASRPQGSNMF